MNGEASIVATRPKIGKVDQQLDLLSETRVSLEGDARKLRRDVRRAMQSLVDVHNGATLLLLAVSGGDENGQGGGDLYRQLADLRALPAIRRATNGAGVAA